MTEQSGQDTGRSAAAPGKERCWEDKTTDLPARTGVYLFKDGDGKILYVGKANNLRARVRSYTRGYGDGRAHVQFLRARIRDLDYIVTDNEKEALILENNLIKKHRPRYNIKLRDDKTYFHLRLTTSENYPRLLLTRRPKKGGGDLLFGPYSSSQAVKQTIRMLQDIFPLRRCQQRFRPRDRACLNFQIGKCLGPCAEKVPEDEYRRIVVEVKRFLQGRKPELVQDLKKRMEEAAREEEYEKAAVLRDRLAAVEKTLQVQKVDSPRPVDRDVIGFCREGDRVAVQLLGYRGGMLLVSRPYNFARVALPDEEVLSSFLSQLYPAHGTPPEEVLVPFLPLDLEVIRESFTQMRAKKCKVRVPQRGEGKKLVGLASRNAREELKRESAAGDDRERALEEMRHKLRLSRLPRWIECVDVSLLGGEAAVGSVVRFIDGEPDRSGYRRYRIKGVSGTDDYAMMREVLTRRFRRAISGETPLPDLLVVDGGKGQLNVALSVMKDLGIEGMDAAGLAKDRPHGGFRQEDRGTKGERVYVPGAKDPVNIKQGVAALLLLQRVRDEAHRFALAYHKKLRGKKSRRSVLEDVPGIGKKKAAAVIKHFGGIKKAAKASEQEIAGVKGIGPADAARIKEYLSKGLHS